jgi:hypothetical protein
VSMLAMGNSTTSTPTGSAGTTIFNNSFNLGQNYGIASSYGTQTTATPVTVNYTWGGDNTQWTMQFASFR